MLTFRCLLVFVLVLASALVVAEESGSGNSPLTQTDTATGGEKAVSAGQYSADLERVGNSITSLMGSVSGQKGLYEGLTTKNAETLTEVVKAREDNGVGATSGQGIAFGGVNLTFGGEVIELDSRHTYRSAPTVYSFIGEGKNHLQGLDSRMQRASKWLNKHTCGGFDWSAQFTSMFRQEVLVDYVKSLGEGVVAAAPMALLGAFAPQLAEIVKWLKLTVGFDITATKADCNAIESTLTHGVRSQMWSEKYANCMAQYTDAREAVRNCNNPEVMGGLPKSDGTLTNPNTSQAAATGANWESNGYNMTKDWVDSLFKSPDQAAAAADAAGTNGSTTGQAKAQEEGIAAAAAGGAGNAVKTLLGRGRDPSMNRYAKALFGEISVSGTGALEIGRKRFQLFKLGLEGEAAAMQNTFEAQLIAHNDILRGAVSSIALAESYKKCKLWTYHIRGGDSGEMPWTRDAALNTKIQAALASDPNRSVGGVYERFTDQTVDALAYYLADLAARSNDANLYAQLEQEWQGKKFISLACKYEFLLYVQAELHDVKKEIDTLAERMTSSGNSMDQHVLTVRRRQYEEAIGDLNDEMAATGFYIATRLPIINKYRPHVPGGYAPSESRRPSWLTQPSGLGR